MSIKSEIYLEVARRANQVPSHLTNQLSIEYYELYAQEKQRENKENVTTFTLDDIRIAARAVAGFPCNKVEAIKEVREKTNCGLKDAKDLVEAVRGGEKKEECRWVSPGRVE